MTSVATPRSQVHFDTSNTMRGHHLHTHADSISPPNVSQNLPHPLMPLGSDSSASYSSSTHLGTSQHLTAADNISLNPDTSSQLDMHRLSHDQLDGHRLAQSSLELNPHVSTFQHPNQHGHQQHQLQQQHQHQIPSFHPHQTANTSLYNSTQGIGSSGGDFSSYGPMYQHYSNYLSLNKCRSNPYQRPSSNNSAAAQAVAAQAAAAAQYASSVFSSYPGFNASAGNLSSTEGTSSATAASLAAALYPSRPHSYDYSGASSTASGGISSLPR
jgi:hypothetical protein